MGSSDEEASEQVADAEFELHDVEHEGGFGDVELEPALDELS